MRQETQLGTDLSGSFGSHVVLPVRQGVRFKLTCIVYKSLSGQAPQYLADDVHLVADSGRRLIWSANYRTCVVPRARNSFGDRDFSVGGPRMRNDLPPKLQHEDTSFGQLETCW